MYIRLQIELVGLAIDDAEVFKTEVKLWREIIDKCQRNEGVGNCWLTFYAMMSPVLANFSTFCLCFRKIHCHPILNNHGGVHVFNAIFSSHKYQQLLILNII